MYTRIYAALNMGGIWRQTLKLFELCGNRSLVTTSRLITAENKCDQHRLSILLTVLDVHAVVLMRTHCSRAKTMTRGSRPTYLYAVGLALHLVWCKTRRVSSIRPYFSHWRSASLCLAILYSSRREKIVKFLQSNPVQVWPKRPKTSVIFASIMSRTIFFYSEQVTSHILPTTNIHLPRSSLVQVWPLTLLAFMFVLLRTIFSTLDKQQIHHKPS